MNTYCIALLALLLPAISGHAETFKGHALSMFDEIKYGPEFEYFNYVLPDAPKGGHLRLAKVGSFDNLNPFILKGIAASGTLMTVSYTHLTLPTILLV